MYRDIVYRCLGTSFTESLSFGRGFLPVLGLVALAF